MTDKVKILALSSGGYADIFKKVYRYCKNELGHEIYAVASSKSIKPYSEFIDSPDQLIVMPEVLEKGAWEDDADVVKKIESLISASEKIVGVPANRLVLSNERTIGRAYSKSHYYWAERKLARLALRDKDIGNRILIRLFKFADDVINHCKPSLCLGAPTGGMWNSVFYYVSRYYGIPCISCNTSMLVRNRHFWASNWGTFNTRITTHYREKLRNADSPTEGSFHHIKNFREKPASLPHYQILWNTLRASLNFMNINKEIIKRAIIRFLPVIKRQKVSNPKPFFQFVVDRYRNYFLARWQRKYYQTLSEQTLSSMNYIYYPFHVEPEMVLNVMAPSWHNQLNTIKMLSYNLPMNYKLLVREHRLNVGRRPTAYLETISRFPGVVLIDAFDDQYKYIKNAGVVVTVNGTTGFEGVLLQRPVLTLDKTFYDGLECVKKAFAYPDLGAAILDCISSFNVDDQYDEKIALFLDAENEVTIDHSVDPQSEYVYIQSVVNELRNQSFPHKIDVHLESVV